MRRVWIIGAVLIVASLVVLSASSYLAYEQVTVATVSIGFTATKITPAGLGEATIASCRLETAEIRYRIDGTAPTTTVGTPLEALETLVISGHDAMVAFRAIRTGGTSGTLNCTYSAP